MSTATEVFDPYREWLGIEPHELPADHYRLLGLARFEADAGKIATAADARMSLIRSNQTGPRGSFTNTLLNEITAAKLCLLSPIAKVQYDTFLQERKNAYGPASAPVTFFPTAVPLMALPPAFSPYQAAGVPTLEPPLAAPPVAPRAILLAPPKQVRKSELAIDEDKPPNEIEPIRKSSLVRSVGIMAIAILLIAGGIWGGSQYLLPPAEKTEVRLNPGGSTTDPGNGEAQPEPPSETPPDPAAKAIVVLQEGSRELSLPPSAAVLIGATSLKIAISENVLTNWSSAEDGATWKFKLLHPGFFKLDMSYSAAYEGEDIRVELLLDEESLHNFHLPPTGGADDFQVVSHTIVVKASGTHTLSIRPTGTVPADSLVIKSIRFIPVGGQP